MAEKKSTAATEEQLAYARVLNIGMWLGLAVLALSFLIYIFGILPAHVQIQDLPKYWSLSAHDYNVAVKGVTGWGWLGMVGKGDYLNYVGVAMLSGLTILCYIVILPILFRKKDMAYAVIAVVEVLVLALAASGLLKTGGH